MARPHDQTGRPAPAGTFGWRPGGRRGGPTVPRADAATRPGLEPLTTTLWAYPSQHYALPGSPMQGDAKYAGATPSWVIWQVLQRYTKPGDTVLDPMCGSGTTLDVCRDTGRNGLGCDLVPRRPDVRRADARTIPLADASVDLVFVDPPYSTHIDYSDDPACIGKLSADEPGRGGVNPYFAAMAEVIREIDRVLRPDRFMALYVSDSFEKGPAGARPAGTFTPIGFETFDLLRKRFTPVDIVAVVRGNAKLQRAHWHGAARDGHYFLRGFNYLFIMHKPGRAAARPRRSRP